MAKSHDIVSHPFAVSFIRTKARELCRRSDFSWSDFDDLQQEMRIYLLEKGHLFDPARGRIEAFINQSISTWVAMHLRFRRRMKRRDSYKVLSLERTRVECDGDITALGAILVNEDGRRLSQYYTLTETERFELCEAVDHAMGKLDPRDREILTHAAENGVASASRAFGISRRQIGNAIARARPHFEKAGLRPD